MQSERYRRLKCRPSFSVGRYADMRYTVYVRDDFTCRGCGYRPPIIPASFNGRTNPPPSGRPPHRRHLQMDHIVPWPDGPTTIGNLQVLCSACNMRKGSHSMAFLLATNPTPPPVFAAVTCDGCPASRTLDGEHLCVVLLDYADPERPHCTVDDWDRYAAAKDA